MSRNRNKVSLQKALIHVLTRDFGFRKSDAKLAYKGLIDALTEAILRGYSVEIRGFGTIYVSSRKPQRINNHFTNGDVIVPMRKTIRFRPSARLKEAINGIRSLIS